MKRTKRLLISLLTLLCCSTGAWAEGELNGVFSVSSTKKVLFSKGNLQYVDENYQFAEHQYDYFGGNQYSNHVDMFANNDYSSPDGDTAWRILSQSEWSYLYTERSVTNTLSEGARYSKATIGGTYKGVIVFPDSYTHPNGTGFAGNCNNAAENYASTVSLEGWALMEAAGCVFLPAAGYNNGGIKKVDDASVYDSSTANDRSRCTPGFYYNEIKLDDWSYNTTCVPVRLVKNYQLQQDAEGNYLLGSVDDWKLFASLVQTTPTANAKMTADIDLGDDQTRIGSTSDNNDALHYKGIFDGQGHTLRIAFVEAGNSNLCAPFNKLNGATIKNLHIMGTIHTAGIHGAGVASDARGTTTIMNVWSDVDVTSTHSGWDECSGIVGCMKAGSLTISDCLFSGSVTANSSYNGGFIGYKDSGSASIQNSLSTGTFNYSSNQDFARGASVSNSYYTQFVGSTTGMTPATSEQLSDGTTTTALNAGRTGDEAVWVQNSAGYPWLRVFNPEIPGIRGDANDDGKVDMADATFVTNIILGTEDATEAADVNNDGTVNMPDAMFIVNKILNGKFPDE